MTYATTADIENELKNISFSISSDVKISAISGFLNQADAVIDMYIGKRYTTPATASGALLVLKKIAIDIVVYRVAKILDLKKSIPIPDSKIIQDITNGDAYKESMRMLTAIRDDKMDLPSETEISATSGLASFHTESGNSAIVPEFKKGTDQW